MVVLLSRKIHYVLIKFIFCKSALLFAQCIFAAFGVSVVQMNTLKFLANIELIFHSFLKSNIHMLVHYFLM